MQNYQLNPQAEQAIHSRYKIERAKESVAALAQGEIDVLEVARQQLGWPSILSLAHKYYPLYPNRKWWWRALERCARQKIRTATLNIRYLLLVLETVKQMALKAAYSGKEALNRLTHSIHKKRYKDDNRLTQPPGIINKPTFDIKGYTLVKWFYAFQGHDNSMQSDTQLACQ